MYFGSRSGISNDLTTGENVFQLEHEITNQVIASVIIEYSDQFEGIEDVIIAVLAYFLYSEYYKSFDNFESRDTYDNTRPAFR